MTDKDKVHKDAEGQFVRTREGAKNNGVSSAKPRDITHSDDATVHRNPPGSKQPKKDWDLNYDEGDNAGKHPA